MVSQVTKLSYRSKLLPQYVRNLGQKEHTSYQEHLSGMGKLLLKLGNSCCYAQSPIFILLDHKMTHNDDSNVHTSVLLAQAHISFTVFLEDHYQSITRHKDRILKCRPSIFQILPALAKSHFISGTFPKSARHSIHISHNFLRKVVYLSIRQGQSLQRR